MKLFIRQLCAWAPGIDTEDQWCEWAAGARPVLEGAKPSVSLVPAITRRRLTLWGRMALEVASTCASELNKDTPCIFASRHGDTRRTLKLLNSLAESEPLSPTAFSLSVHNSSAGVFSIVQKVISPSVALAAGKDTFGQALVEAHGMLSQGYDEVLLVLVDEPIADFYQNDADEKEIPHAVAMVLNRSKGKLLEFDFSTKAVADAVNKESFGMSFLKYWYSQLPCERYAKDGAMSYISKRSHWRVSKV